MGSFLHRVGGWALFLGSLLTCGARADGDLSQYRGKFRIQKEVELKVLALQHLAAYVELNESCRNALTPTMLETYLDDIRNLRALPLDLQRQLTEGIAADLSLSPVLSGKAKALLGVDGSPLNSLEIAPASDRSRTPSPLAPTVSADGTKRLILPGELPLSHEALVNADVAKLQRASEVLKDRWKSLPFPVQKKVVALDRLDPVSRAVLMRHGSDFRPKPDCPPPLKRVLENLEFLPTGGYALEMRDVERHQIYDPEKYLEELEILAKAARFQGFLEEPHKKHDGEKSLHVHISSTAKRDLSPLIRAFNYLQLLRHVDHGDQAAMFTKEPMVSKYRDDLHEKGLVHLVSEDHFEIRTHTVNPRRELEEILRWLSLPEAEALNEIYAEVHRRLIPENVALLQRQGEGSKALAGIAMRSPHPEARRLLESSFDSFLSYSAFHSVLSAEAAAELTARVVHEVSSYSRPKFVSWLRGAEISIPKLELLGLSQPLKNNANLQDAVLDHFLEGPGLGSFREFQEPYRGYSVDSINLEERLRARLKGGRFTQFIQDFFSSVPLRSWGRYFPTLNPLAPSPSEGLLGKEAIEALAKRLDTPGRERLAEALWSSRATLSPLVYEWFSRLLSVPGDDRQEIRAWQECLRGRTSLTEFVRERYHLLHTGMFEHLPWLDDPRFYRALEEEFRTPWNDLNLRVRFDLFLVFWEGSPSLREKVRPLVALLPTELSADKGVATLSRAIRFLPDHELSRYFRWFSPEVVSEMMASPVSRKVLEERVRRATENSVWVRLLPTATRRELRSSLCSQVSAVVDVLLEGPGAP